MEKWRPGKGIVFKRKIVAEIKPLEMKGIVAGEQQGASSAPDVNACTMFTRPTRLQRTCPGWEYGM
ncbi:MAG: hypothetical protein R6T99_11285 [Bacteroidales bacterium]